jgi:hypothetical protein
MQAVVCLGGAILATQDLQPRAPRGEHGHPFAVRGLVLAGAFIVTQDGMVRAPCMAQGRPLMLRGDTRTIRRHGADYSCSHSIAISADRWPGVWTRRARTIIVAKLSSITADQPDRDAGDSRDFR